MKFDSYKKDELLIVIDNLKSFRDKALRNAEMFGNGTTYGMEYTVSAMRWGYKLQIAEQTYRDRFNLTNKLNICHCGSEIPNDDPYDGYCIDCG